MTSGIAAGSLPIGIRYSGGNFWFRLFGIDVTDSHRRIRKRNRLRQKLFCALLIK